MNLFLRLMLVGRLGETQQTKFFQNFQKLVDNVLKVKKYFFGEKCIF